MNNKRVIFYFISLLILLSLSHSALADLDDAQHTVVRNLTFVGGSTRVNITTGAYLNVTCTGISNAIAAVGNISLFHSFNHSSPALHRINATNVTNSAISFISEYNGSGSLLSVTFRVLNGTVNFTETGALGGAGKTYEILQDDGNYTVSCQQSLNTSNATHTGVKNSSNNITITIDRTKPNFTISSLNVTDGVNTVSLSKLNATAGGQAFLRNETLKVTVTLLEPNMAVGEVRMYWVFNTSAVPQATHGTLLNSVLNPDNLTMNRQLEPVSSNNQTVYNGSLRYAGNGSTDRFANMSDGRQITFILAANDSAGNVQNLSNGGGGFNITLDGTAPSASFKLNKERIEILESIEGTCEANDTSPITFTFTLTKPSGGTVTKTSTGGGSIFKATFSSTDTGEAGKYKILCEVEDSVAFKTPVTKEFTAFYEAEDAVSVEEEAEAEKKVAEVDLSRSVGGQAPEETITGIQGETTTFTLDGETEHALTFLEITATSATLRFESSPVDVTFRVGETKEVDLDGDGDNDISITLDSVADEEAKVRVKPVKVPPPQEETTPTPKEEVTPTEKPSNTGVIIVIVLILAVVVAAYFLLKGKGKKKKGEIRFTSKDLSSEFKF